MPYSLGVDLGTTFSTVAVLREVGDEARFGGPDHGGGHDPSPGGPGGPGGHGSGGGSGAERIEMADVGGRGFAVPSVLFVGSDGTVLVGEAAARRAATDPLLVVREIKRRLGDPAPIIIGDAGYSPALLTAALLRGVLAQIIQAEGSDPQRVMLTHPANWGSFRRDVFIEAANLSGLGATFELITEPVAAALWHARRDTIPDGTILATYDLGGGTFDAAVVAKRGDTFEVLGQPMGLDKMGGVDFDEALIAFVDRCLGGALRRLDPASDAAARTMRSLRQEVVAAKETLSTDVAATINVALPDGFEAVRITRREFEDMIRDQVGETLAVMRATLEEASVTPAEVHKVLLVGGSSRIPLIFELLERELGITAALDDHPKNVVALGAALALAGRAFSGSPAALRPQRDSAPVTPPTNAARLSQATVFEAPLPLLDPALGVTERVGAEPPDPAQPDPSRGDSSEDHPGDIPEGLVLLVISGPDGGAVRPLVPDATIEVGRDVSPAAGWALYDPRVSRRHARLGNDGATVELQDLGSLNHSYLDGVMATAGTAKPGQTLRFGNTVALLLRREPGPGPGPGPQLATDLAPIPAVELPGPARGGRFLRKGFDTDQYVEHLELRRSEINGLTAASALLRRHRHPVAGYRWVHPVPLRRRADPGFLELTVGYADSPTGLAWSLPTDLDADGAEVLERFTGSFVDRDAPVVLALHDGRRLGVEGPVETVMGVLRQLVAQVVLHHHPADVAVAVITGQDDAGDLGVSLGRGHALGLARTTLVKRPHLRAHHLGGAGSRELIGPVEALAAAVGSDWGDRQLVMVGEAAAVTHLRRTLLERGALPADRLSELAVGSTDELGPGALGLRLQADDGMGHLEGPGAPTVSGPMLAASLSATNAEHLLALPSRL